MSGSPFLPAMTREPANLNSETTLRPTAAVRPAALLLFLGFVAIYVVWGSTYLAIRYAVETIPPWCDMKVCGNREKAKRHYKRRH